MSVNDPLPWIAPVLALIHRAVAADVPVLGHCLGGQLMAKALGAQVSAQAKREIGWGEVVVARSPEAAHWFGTDLRAFTTFHWHGETFALPSAAQRVLSSAYCENQGFVLGKHLGLQCHVEMTAELVEAWCHSGEEEIAAHSGPAVQSTEQMQCDLDGRLASLHAVADRLYARWFEGLRR